MIDLRISGIVATAAFLLSFLLGLISGAAMTVMLIRALIFAVTFFLISGAVKILITRFLPELLETAASEDESFLPGARVDITAGDTSDFSGDSSALQLKPVFMGAQPDESDDELGDIVDLMRAGTGSLHSGRESSTGMDQDTQDSYNEGGGIGSFSEFGSAEGFKPSAPPVLNQKAAQVKSFETAGSFGSEDTLPDLDSMAGAFSTTSMEEDTDNTEYSVSAPSRKKSSSGSKEAAWAGDFPAKDMAKGLQTILSKDKEG